MTMIKFKAGYADRGRAICKGCQQDIEKDSLQLGVMTQVFVRHLLKLYKCIAFIRFSFVVFARTLNRFSRQMGKN